MRKVVGRDSKTWPVILITGPRQVGKSSLLNMVKEPERRYVTLDDLPARDLAINDPRAFIQKYAPPVIIDEVQYAPNLFPYIKIWVDEHRTEYNIRNKEDANPAGAFWLTGSQKFSLMKGVQESLAGRVAIIDMLGLSHKEIIKQSSASKPFWPDEIDMHKEAAPFTVMDVYNEIWRGSFPEFAANPNIDRNEFFNSYMQTYIQRDVRDYLGIASELKFYRFVRAVAVRTGNLVNYEDLARDCDIDKRTAQKWLDALLASGLVYLLPPYSSNPTNRIVKTPKLYFLDTGLASYLANIDTPEALESSYLNGAILETYALTELLKSFWHNGKSVGGLYFYRDSNSKEIDFILERNLTLYPIEVKKTSTVKSSDSANLRLAENLNKKTGAGALICLTDTVMPIPNKDAFAVPLWEI
jgi:predicted AAA+ superfamily ATPase